MKVAAARKNSFRVIKSNMQMLGAIKPQKRVMRNSMHSHQIDQSQMRKHMCMRKPMSIHGCQKISIRPAADAEQMSHNHSCP